MVADELRQILLVEDNPHDADLTRIGFKRNAISNPTVHARNGEEALDYLLCTGKHEGRDPCVNPLAVVLDLKLPKVSGIEVLRALRQHEATGKSRLAKCVRLKPIPGKSSSFSST